MIFAAPGLAQPLPRLLDALRDRGHVVEPPGSAPDPRARAPRHDEIASPVSLVLGAPRPGGGEPDLALEQLPEARLLVISLIGAHPDARSAPLRTLWQLEEKARGAGRAALTLRLGPLVGPASPLWLRLGSHPRLPRGGRKLLQPVLEEEVVEAIHRALAGRVPWEGCHEIVGPEVWSLAELADLAGDSTAGPAGAWEPSLDVLEEQRLCEAEPWLAHFGMEARPLAAAAQGWAA